MLNNLIERERNSLLKQLSNKELYEQRIKEIEKRATHLFNRNSEIGGILRALEKEYTPNIFFKTFSREYRDKLKEIEDLKKEMSDNRAEREKLSDERRKLELAIEHIDKRKIKSDMEKLDDPIQATYEVIKSYPSQRENAKLMSEIISVNPELIREDKTQDIGVYASFLEKLKSKKMENSEENKELIEAIDRIISKLNEHGVHHEKYSIPSEYVVEFIKASLNNENEGEWYNNKNLENYIKLFVNTDRKISPELGKLLEHLYKDDYSEIGLFKIKKSEDDNQSLEEKLSNYYNKGIKATDDIEEGMAPQIGDMAVVSNLNTKTFLDILSRAADGGKYLVLQVSKSAIGNNRDGARTTIWGVEVTESGEVTSDYYFLPRNVLGLMNNGTFTKNQADNPTKYNIHVYDGAISPNVETRVVRPINNIEL